MLALFCWKGCRGFQRQDVPASRSMASLGVVGLLLLSGCKEKPSSPGEPAATAGPAAPAQAPARAASPGPEVRELPALSSEDLKKAWQIDVGGKKGEALSLVKEILAPCPVGIEVAPEAGDAAKRVAEGRPGLKSRFQALEEILGQVGLFPDYGRPMSAQARFFARGRDQEKPALTVTLRAGPRPSPVAFAGPMLVRVAELDEQAGATTANLKVEALNLDLPEEIREATREEMSPMSITFVGNAEGRSLRGSKDPNQGTEQPDGFLLLQQPIGLKNLLRAERELTIRGELKLMRPGIRRSYDLAEPREGAVMKVGAGEVELKRYEEKADGSARLELVARNAGGVVEVEGLGPEKQAVARTHRSSFSTGETTRISIGLREAPSSLLVTWHGDSSPEIIEFELKGVPLVQAETRPLAHKSLKFKGSSPVTLESDGRLLRDGGSMFPEIVLRLRNHSNKDIREIEAEVSYLNAEGEKLNRGNTTLRGDPMEMARRQDPRWLPADSERRHRAKLVLAKKEAATAELTPRKVLFTDGSEWFAPVSCPKDQRPCILGKIRTPAGAKSQVLSGYTGIDSKDSRAWGLTSVEVGPDSLSHWSRNGSDWGKNSAMHAMGDGVAHHQHEEVAEGSYLVFAARKEGGPVDWKWVKIDAPDQQLRVDLDLSRASSGSLEVKVPHAGGADDEVSLTPLNATGPYPLPLESLTKLRAGDMLKLKAKVNGGLALFEGLFPGRYLVHSGKHTEETQVTQGKRSQVSFP